MTLINPRHYPLTGAYNFRDLGGYQTQAGHQTKWRRLLRADSPHRLTEQAIASLLKLGLTTVIDLRSQNELAQAANPFEEHRLISYHNISLFDHLDPKAMRKAHASDSADPLLEFYTSTLAKRQPAIRAVLTAIASAAPGAVMFHCTAGKDRTGLISALLLGMANVGSDEIISDYAQTKPLIVGLVKEFLALAEKTGTDIESYRPLLECNPATMRAALAHIQRRYRSINGYLEEIGLEQEYRQRLADRLLR